MNSDDKCYHLLFVFVAAWYAVYAARPCSLVWLSCWLPVSLPPVAVTVTLSDRRGMVPRRCGRDATGRRRGEHACWAARVWWHALVCYML